MATLAMAGGIQAAVGASPAFAAQAAPAAAASHSGHTTAPPKWMHLINLHSAYEHALGHVTPGKIGGISYRIGYRPKVTAAGTAPAASCTEPNCPLVYHGGPVEHTARIYLLLWGPTWATDSGEITSAAYLQSFYQGLGVQPQDTWSRTTSPYADTTGFPAFSGSQFAGVFTDTSTPPTGTTQPDFAAEAATFAASQNLTASPQDDQVVIATQSGTCPDGFYAPGCNGGSGYYCAYHSNVTSGVTFTNMPYLLDAGAGCGEGFVNTPGTYDGFSMVGGHEYAETITDPYPNNGWIDLSDSVSGGEIADKCAWGGQLWGTPDPAGNVTLSTGTFAMQSLWSNAAGGCVMASTETISVINPGSQTTSTGTSVSLQVNAVDSANLSLSYSATGLPAGLSIDSSTGLITGTPTTGGTSHVTVTATDPAGNTGSASFTWTVNQVCRRAQVLKNPGFETGRLAPWHASLGVLTRHSRLYASHSGKWLALLQERIPRHTNYLSQLVSIGPGCSGGRLSFWLKVQTRAPRRRVFATLKAEILTPRGRVLRVLRTFTNRDAHSYRDYTFKLSGYAGRRIVVRFLGRDNLRRRTTSFLIDDTSLRIF